MTVSRNRSSHAHLPSRRAIAGLIMACAGTSAEAEPFLLHRGGADTAAPASARVLPRRWSAPAAASQTALATATVSNCLNSGAGSLRDAVATDAAIIDMTALGCSTISLTTGAIIVNHNAANVAFMGPTDHLLTIDGNNNGRVLVHNGEGLLTLDHVKLTNGSYANGYAGGGCVYANGSATLQNATISNCTLNFTDYDANGGAIYVMHDLTLNDSVISGNLAQSAKDAHGGGAYVFGTLVMNRSTLRDNTASSPVSSTGGGAKVLGVAELYSATVSGNAALFEGGLDLRSSATVSNSTISGNQAATQIGGLLVIGPLVLDNSTVALNTHGSTQFGAGIRASASMLAHSSIVANNTSTSSGQNVDILCQSCVVTGSNNLIMGSNGALPAGTILVDPMLGPLADNGGPTKTHALLAESPALDNGSNIHDFAFDQRGHVRSFGFGPDIGAFEAGVDAIFADGFD